MRHRIGTGIEGPFRTVAHIFKGGCKGKLRQGLQVQATVYGKIRAAVKIFYFDTIFISLAVHETEIADPAGNAAQAHIAFDFETVIVLFVAVDIMGCIGVGIRIINNQMINIPFECCDAEYRSAFIALRLYADFISRAAFRLQIPVSVFTI